MTTSMIPARWLIGAALLASATTIGCSSAPPETVVGGDAAAPLAVRVVAVADASVTDASDAGAVAYRSDSPGQLKRCWIMAKD